MDAVKENLLHQLYEARESYRKATRDCRLRGVDMPIPEEARTIRMLVDRLWDHAHPRQHTAE